MSTPVALLLLAAAFVLTVAASVVLARGLDRIGQRLGFSEALLGMVTALGADAPEIASAVAAVIAGHEETGVGVVVGSNVFNLAALLGVVGPDRRARDASTATGWCSTVVSPSSLRSSARLSRLTILPGGSRAALSPWSCLAPYVIVSALHERRTFTSSPRRYVEAVAEEQVDARRDRVRPAGDRRSTPSPSLRLSRRSFGGALRDGGGGAIARRSPLTSSTSCSEHSCLRGLDEHPESHRCGPACAPRPWRCVCERGSQLEQREHPRSGSACPR